MAVRSNHTTASPDPQSNTGSIADAALIPFEAAQLPRIGIPATYIPAEHPALVYLARLAPGSRRTMRGALDTIARLLTGGLADHRTLPWQDLRYQHTQAIRARLADRYAAATANKLLAALRGCLQEAWRLELMDAETYRRAADLRSVRGSTLPKGRALAGAELRALLATCQDGTPAGARDGALLALLYAGGLRRSEACALRQRDYDALDGCVTVRAGKGNKARTVYIAEGAMRAMDAWLALLDAAGGPLFRRIRAGGHIGPEGLTDEGIAYLLRRRCTRAGIRGASPHDMRRSMISDLLDAGADISTVQRLAGHASVVTTSRYDRRGEAAKRKTANLLSV